MKTRASWRSRKVLAGPKVRYSTATKLSKATATASKLSLRVKSPRVKALSATPSKKRTAVATTGGKHASWLKRSSPAQGEGSARTPHAKSASIRTLCGASAASVVVTVSVRDISMMGLELTLARSRGYL